jgi:hydroxymethylpyrimidine pyrophosphatase-like HAD family hydrolase
MRALEWIKDRDGYQKVDYEHHAFGNPGLNVVDPAYDLASAIFELGFGKKEEEQLIASYVSVTGDTNIEERLILHKIVCGTSAREVAQHRMGRARSHADLLECFARDLAARDFLTLHLSRFSGRAIRGRTANLWTNKIFVLDLDGVFDGERLYFPHTTLAGLRALRLLRANEYSVIVNTGRSAQYAREYCAAYGLAGGIAEHGAVYVDAIAGREVPLVTGAEAQELAIVRERIRSHELFAEPTYEHAIRVHGYGNSRPVGLDNDLTRKLLQDCKHLRFFSTPLDTYIVPTDKNKGTGLRSLLAAVGVEAAVSAAMGDSDADLDMLAEVHHAYAPANCSRSIREFSAMGRCRVMKRTFQSGLLLAVKDLIRRTHGSDTVPSVHSLDDGHVLNRLLAVADYGQAKLLLAGLKWWTI